MLFNTRVMSHSSPSPSKRKSRKHVVIVGAGFAGLHAALALRNKPVDVTIIDRKNYHTFQPLLYEVAMAGLEADDIAYSVRDLFQGADNIRFHMGILSGIDREERRLHLTGEMAVDYDYLIMATGTVVNYFGVEGAAEHAFPLKNLPDAVGLKSHVLYQFERYDRAPQRVTDGTLTFVLVGGGPSGVEMAGALVELLQTLQGDFPTFDVLEKARVVLVEMQPDLLPPYEKKLREYTRQTLEARGVEVMTEATVERIEANAVYLADGTRIPTQTLVWTAGVKANPVADLLNVEQLRGGQVVVNEDLSVPEDPRVFVAGDMAAIREESGGYHPQLAQVAMQSGRHAAKQILAHLDSQPTTAFQYTDYGQMATIGRNAAVAELANGTTFKGFFAWIVWVILHIVKLVGFRNRLSVFMDWIYNYFTYERHARLIIDLVPLSEDVPFKIDEAYSEEVEERFKVSPLRINNAGDNKVTNNSEGT